MEKETIDKIFYWGFLISGITILNLSDFKFSWLVGIFLLIQTGQSVIKK